MFETLHEQRLLAVFAHPDDETYAAGGLLAAAADLGACVSLLCVTGGEAGMRHPKSDAPDTPLGPLRLSELAASCKVLGIAHWRCLGIADGAIEQALDALAREVAREMTAHPPTMIVTLGWDGAYGHRDHIATTRAVHRAQQAAAPAAQILYCAFPKGFFLPTYRRLKKLQNSPIHPELSEQQIGVAQPSITLSLAHDGLRERKRASIAAHRSQMAKGRPETFLQRGLLDLVLTEEWYVAASPFVVDRQVDASTVLSHTARGTPFDLSTNAWL